MTPTDFYEGFCKTFLWPIFHYLALSDSLDKDFEVKAWEAYYAANLAYAKKVCEVWQKGDLVSTPQTPSLSSLPSSSPSSVLAAYSSETIPQVVDSRMTFANAIGFVDLDSRLPSPPGPQDDSRSASGSDAVYLALLALSFPVVGILQMFTS